MYPVNMYNYGQETASVFVFFKFLFYEFFSETNPPNFGAMC